MVFLSPDQFVPEAFLHGGVPSGWVLPPQGYQADTYMNETVVLQRRPKSKLKRWKETHRMLETIDDPDGLLSLARHRLQVEANSFWVCFDRQDLPGSPGHEYKDWPPARFSGAFLESLPDLLQSCSLLRQAPLQPDMLCLEPSKAQANRRYSAAFVREAARSMSVAIDAPAPEPMPIVNSHGDALLKNMVLTADGYRLIDWEDSGPAPLGSDLSHAVAWLMLRLEPEDWTKPLSTAEPAIIDWIGCSQQQWRRLLFWTLISEVVFWRHGDDLARIYREASSLLLV